MKERLSRVSAWKLPDQPLVDFVARSVSNDVPLDSRPFALFATDGLLAGCMPLSRDFTG